jgi:hypothetical protein
MPSVNSTPYATNTKTVELLEREKVNLTTITIFRNGGKVNLNSGTYSLIKPDGSKLVDEVAVTINANVAEYTHSAASLPNTLQLGEGYIQEWTLNHDGGHPDANFTYRRTVSIVRRRLYPVVYDGDLTSVYSDLASLRPSSLESYQPYIDDAWYTIIRRLRTEGGGLEYLVISPESMFEAHRHLSLYLIWRDFHSSLGQSNGRYLDLSQEHYKLYQDEWKRINFIYDYDHDGKADEPDLRTAKTPVVYLSNPGLFGRFRYRTTRYRS